MTTHLNDDGPLALDAYTQMVIARIPGAGTDFDHGFIESHFRSRATVTECAESLRTARAFQPMMLGHETPCQLAQSQAGNSAFDLASFIARQKEFSAETFGPGARTQGVSSHIRSELDEIAADPTDVEEWVDVIILAIDGAWRSGASPATICQALEAKFAKNRARTWPDWRTVDQGVAIEHVREAATFAQPVQEPQRQDQRATITVPTEPLTACPVLAEQIRQCELMLSDTIPWLRANPQWVDMDEIFPECGQPGCLYHWHMTRHLMGREAVDSGKLIGLPEYSEWATVFGDSYAGGTLVDRESRLREHLSSLKARAAAGEVA